MCILNWQLIINNCECGSKASLFKDKFNAYIKCNKCENTRGGFSTIDTLISIWNKENNKGEK